MDRVSFGKLIVAASSIYDSHRDSAEAACQVRLSGFTGGAQWMAKEMARYRRITLACPVFPFTILGVQKYGLAILGATAFALPAILLFDYRFLPLTILGFYLVESRFVFAFPLAIDGCSRPLRESHAMVRQRHNILQATFSTMGLAAVMMFGGFFGHGWLRSWCLGCLGVILWYENIRERKPQ